ncbi:hypothetical protein UFOVP1155_54 [uncultured Caudovirales phage]|uniref:Uncharacterized protein n=1 Tax=uncultured Caudovirales phage TaxID=2100421 RepID=A0A6J5R4I9_9CAUD|nr:hypothetical protein UFOVP1155_54 [uncultured Caudovirales phage]
MNEENWNNTAGAQSIAKGATLSGGLELCVFDIADSVIEHAYPNIYGKEKGWWGEQRIPNWGILRGAIASAILDERKHSNVELTSPPTKKLNTEK